MTLFLLLSMKLARPHIYYFNMCTFGLIRVLDTCGQAWIHYMPNLDAQPGLIRRLQRPVPPVTCHDLFR